MDIQMPDLTGLQLSKIVKGKPILFLRLLIRNLLQVDAIDYLLKPFEFERFIAFKSEK
jgi:response regulator of citrate/malate metabolism